MKKLISILLSVMLVVSGLSLSTFAADEAYRYDFDTGFLAGNGSSAEIHGKGDVKLGMFFHVIPDGAVAGAAA